MRDLKLFLPSMTFGTDRTVQRFERREGGVIVVVHIPGFSLLVLVHRAKERPVTFPR